MAIHEQPALLSTLLANRIGPDIFHKDQLAALAKLMVIYLTNVGANAWAQFSQMFMRFGYLPPNRQIFTLKN